MELRKNDLRIRNAGKADAGTLCRWWNDGKVMEHAGFPYGLGISAEEISESLSKDSDEEKRRLIIEYRDMPIGEMNFRMNADGNASIGIKICETEYQNAGLGRKCLSMLINALFEKGCEKIVLDTDPDNSRARHVYELLGFRNTGIRRDCWKDQLGRLRSAADYELALADFHDFS